MMIVGERPGKEGIERISVLFKTERTARKALGWGLWSRTRAAERGSQLEWRESVEERREVRSEMSAQTARGPHRNLGVILRILGFPPEGWFAEKDQL